MSFDPSNNHCENLGPAFSPLETPSNSNTYYQDCHVSPPVHTVPEPNTALLLGIGLVIAFLLTRGRVGPFGESL